MSTSPPSDVPAPGPLLVGDILADWQRETTRFGFQRLDRNLHSLLRLVSARNPIDLVSIQHEWGLQTSLDYQNEARRMAALLLATPATPEEVQISSELVA